MKKVAIVLVVVGIGTAIALKACPASNAKNLKEPVVKYLKDSDVVSPKTVKALGKKVDGLLNEASKKTHVPVLADILDKASNLNAKQQKKLAKYLKKNFA